QRDIRVIQEELPIDILEFFILTPLPGSADHRDMYLKGEWMNPDMNLYDVEHVTTHHPRMTDDEWRGIYERAWHLYYSPQHMETLMRRAEATGAGAIRLLWAVMNFYGNFRYEHVHPLQAGIFRRKLRATRRPGLPRENPLVFYPRRLWETLSTFGGKIGLYWWLYRHCKRLRNNPAAKQYTDLAIQPMEAADEESLQINELADAAKSSAAKTKLLPIGPAKLLEI